MRKKKTDIISIITIAMLIMTGCSGQAAAATVPDSSGESAAQTQVSNNSITEDVLTELFSDKDMEIGYDEENCTTITFASDKIQVNGSGAEINQNTVTITEEGDYLITGDCTDGQILVDTDKSNKLHIIFENVTMTNDSIAPVYIKQADKVFITLAEGSQNSLSVSNEITTAQEDSIDAVIFSKEDITLNGNGSLTLSSTGNGITSKDDLAITGGTYTITATGHALEGKDSVRIADGEFTLNTGKDGIHCDNTEDTTLGTISVAGGTYHITAEDDGMSASGAFTLLDGDITVSKSMEGIEGQSITISGGQLTICSEDDGLNVSLENSFILISGGIITVNASGDGIDSNGDITMTAGEVYISGPTSRGDGSLDYENSATISGGIFVAADNGGMMQNFSTAEQGSILLNTQASQSEEIMVTDESGNQIISFTPQKTYQSVLISAPSLVKDGTYTIQTGSEEQTVTLTELLYGTGMGPGGKGGMGGGKGMRNDGGQRPEGKPPEDGQPPMEEKLPPEELPANKESSLPQTQTTSE